MVTIAVETVGTTQFQNNEEVVVTDTRNGTRVSNELRTTDTGYKQNMIKDFLTKPITLSAFAWNAETQGTSLYNGLFPEDMVTVGVYKEKLRGFRGIRGTMVFRLEANGTPFQNGLILMSFVPFAGMVGVKPNFRNRTLMAESQLPHVVLDIACQTEAILRIPFVSPCPYYDLVSGTNSLGKLNICPYTPKYVGTGSTTVDFTLFANFEDVEVVTPVWTAEGDIIDEEAKQGVVSSSLTKLSKVAGSLSAVPSLSAIAGTASWVLAAMSGTAAAFGYSKPNHEEVSKRVTPYTQSNMANYDGIDFSTQLGLSASNKVDVLPSFSGLDQDEMSINFLVQQSGRWGLHTWNLTEPVGTILSSFDVFPGKFATRYTNANGVWLDSIPLSYLSYFFRYWRGSIIVHIKIAKTKYHSGRLLISFNPTGSTAASPTNAQSVYVYRQIIDLRETNEIELAIPFVSVHEWEETIPFTTNGDTSTAGIGKVTISVMNALKCPDTCGSVVSLVYTVKGGPDFEFACPRENAANGIYMDDAWTAESGSIGSSGSITGCDNMSVSGIGSCSIPGKTLDAAKFTMGEQVSSVLQLMKRWTLINIPEIISTPYTSINPFMVGVDYFETGEELLKAGPSRDYFTYFSLMYALCRGSMRVMYYSPHQPVTAATTQLLVNTQSNGSVFGETEWGSYTSSTHIANWPKDDVVQSAQVPAYVPFISRLVTPYLGGTVGSCITDSPVWVRFRTSKLDGTAIATGHFFRSVGDDCSLGYFVGVPPLMVSVAE